MSLLNYFSLPTSSKYKANNLLDSGSMTSALFTVLCQERQPARRTEINSTNKTMLPDEPNIVAVTRYKHCHVVYCLFTSSFFVLYCILLHRASCLQNMFSQ